MTHTGLKPYCCAQCKAQFTTKSNLERHILRRHGVLDKEGQAKYVIKLSQENDFEKNIGGAELELTSLGPLIGNGQVQKTSFILEG